MFISLYVCIRRVGVLYGSTMKKEVKCEKILRAAFARHSINKFLPLSQTWGLYLCAAFNISTVPVANAERDNQIFINIINNFDLRFNLRAFFKLHLTKQFL